MFFLGIAGSFLPYLLGVGVLFFLTLGMNGKQPVEFTELDEGKNENFTLESTGSSIENNFYFFNDTEDVHNSDQLILTKLFCPEFFNYCLTHNIPVFNTPVYAKLFIKSHSGLSPPALIS